MKKKSKTMKQIVSLKEKQNRKYAAMLRTIHGPKKPVKPLHGSLASGYAGE